jgi:hypothetical protein
MSCHELLAVIVFVSVLCRDAPDIRLDNPACFDIRYPAGYQIVCRISGRISGKAGYRISGKAGYRISGRISG